MNPLISPVGVLYYQEPPNLPLGNNRADGDSVLSADDDWGAALEFLREFQDRRATFKTYAKEIEKFLLWLIHVRKVSVSALRRGDWLAYCDFLDAPPASWQCSKGTKKWKPSGEPNPDWRPFVAGHPSDRTVRLSKEVVKTFYTWLVDSGHLDANPCAARNKRNATGAFNQQTIMERIIPDHLMQHLLESIDAGLAQSSEEERFKWERMRWVIRLYAGTGIRLSEGLGHWNGRQFVLHRMGDVKPNPGRTRWFLNIVGKGNKPRQIELFDDTMGALRRFRRFLALPALPGHQESTPLIPRVDLESGINVSSLDSIFRAAFAQAASTLPAKLDQPPYYGDKDVLGHDLSALENASAHWLRHTHTTSFLKKFDGDLKRTMLRLGHADVNTTMQYLHVLDYMD